MTRVDDELVIKLSRVWMATPALTHPRVESASWANPRLAVGSRRENEFGKKTKVLMFYSFAAGSRDHDWRTRARQGTRAIKEKWKCPDEKNLLVKKNILFETLFEFDLSFHSQCADMHNRRKG